MEPEICQTIGPKQERGQALSEQGQNFIYRPQVTSVHYGR